MERDTQSLEPAAVSRRKLVRALAIGTGLAAVGLAERPREAQANVQAQATTSWGLTGNSATTPATHFLGTTDTQPLVIRTNNTERVRITADGNVGIGITNPNEGKLVVFHDGRSQPKPQMLIIRQWSNTGAGTNSNALLRFSHSNGQNSRDWITGTGSSTLFGHPDHFGIHDTVSGTALVINTIGNIGIGTTTPGAKLHVNGTTRTNVVEITGGSDLAERFAQADGSVAEPGTVMVIDEQHPGQVCSSQTAYDEKVVGIVSGAGGVQPGLTLQQTGDPDGILQGELVVAIAGRVYCKAEAAAAPIKPGDLLTTSTVPGHCMKATDRARAQGAILGKALTGLDTDTGLVLVLVNLQ